MAERLRRLADKLANTSVSVLITGESGVGKELFARRLHYSSPRSNKPFVAVNCASLSAGILESELFGHDKGAFTGAIRSHAGLFEQANGGTLFLDEIGEIAPFIQAKLLRVLQEREVRRMGGAVVRRVDVRIICATNANLAKKVEEGAFREDIYYRINVVQVRVPPLRERVQDIDDFIDHYFKRQCLPPPLLSDDARNLLYQYEWPGNFRELENELERLTALYDDVREITANMVSERIIHREDAGSLDLHRFYETPLPKAVEYLEERLLKYALARSNWNKTQTARVLGLSRQGLLKKIKRYGIQRQGYVVGEEDGPS
ncbi:MAG: AAA domain-containing protein [Candidatus Latescibacteria bacterium]|nr:AAA domain-containing protein [Candidatus Latescibacterota bacterium]NIM22056.1 AAA domain-containing protein [Candidatus Latescibacterota bacterium]NIM66075.1 AAA domain-containing protein [Candidatus Latescibacterota bacterium]NIO02483.1 AAA domain-containing protein [Candidatus Latescibacterota bacterium]NIO29394.1 AAA domain-containing protein [Candidatus Latescibacterota bacterium]